MSFAIQFVPRLRTKEKRGPKGGSTLKRCPPYGLECISRKKFSPTLHLHPESVFHVCVFPNTLRPQKRRRLFEGSEIPPFQPNLRLWQHPSNLPSIEIVHVCSQPLSPSATQSASTSSDKSLKPPFSPRPSPPPSFSSRLSALSYRPSKKFG